MALSPFTFPIDAEEQQSVYWESTTDKRSQAGEEWGVKEGDKGTCNVVVLKCGWQKKIAVQELFGDLTPNKPKQLTY